MRLFGKADLGASTMCGASQTGDECGSNGLPLTPNSIRILGDFQKLKNVDHPRLCKYIDLVRGKHERVIIVSEHYPTSLHTALSSGSYNQPLELLTLAHSVLEGLAYLNSEGLVHRNLSPDNILFDTQGNVKLSKYGVYHMTHSGADVRFPIGTPRYMCPELLCQGPVLLTERCATSDEPQRVRQAPLGSKVDVWALGVILLEALWGFPLWEDLPLKQIFCNIISLVKTDVHPLDLLAKQYKQEDTLQNLPPGLLQLLRLCLNVSVRERPLPTELLDHSVFREHGITPTSCLNGLHRLTITGLGDDDLQNSSVDFNYREVDYLSDRTFDEVYYLWCLAGGDLESVLKKAGVIRDRPPITKIARYIGVEGELFSEPMDPSTLLADTVIPLPLDQLRERLQQLDPIVYYSLLEEGNSTNPQLSSGMHPSQSSGDLLETSKLPLIIREKDVEYQFHKLILYSRLLQGYPKTRNHILKEARSDVPPLVRSQVWAALLGVQDSAAQTTFTQIDKDTPTSTDRQIEVDIPRCHQYSGLLSSPAGHAKFKRILKAWVVSHPHYVYWQGLDSLCAPFLFLNFNNEACAYACLAAFIPKYLNNFFLKDNSAVIQEYLAVFSHLISFHDPELSNHLNHIGFVPELYAIPWFLTMFAHVFPLHKILHLWDTLLLGNSSFPLYIGVAILEQLRDQLLSFGFNECILLFSDMPQIVIETVVQESVRLFRTTPRSATFRQHAPDNDVSKASKVDSDAMETSLSFTPGNSLTQLHIDVISLEDLKQERCPQISAEDLLKLCELHISGSSPLRNPARRNKSDKAPLLVIDIRPKDSYIRGTIPGSINIPHISAFTPEGMLHPSSAVTTLGSYKHQVKVVMGGQANGAVQFSEALLRLGYSKVCVLHKGIDSLKHSGYLTVPPSTEF